MRYVWLIAGLIALAGPTYAQDGDEPDAVHESAEPGKPKKERPPLTGRRLACQQAAEKKGLRGQDRLDDMAVCAAEARLDCLKQAIAAKKRGPERKTSIEECMTK